MVKLILVSPKGNQGVRYFPYHGYLGLTPLKFEGLVRTQLEQDGKCLPAKEITVSVRCYESRQGRLGALHTTVLADYTVSLWKKPDHQDYADIGDSEHQFRLSVPVDVPSPSTANYFQEYRVFWRIEAIIYHAPLTGVGSRQARYYDIPLTRYDVPSPACPPSPITPLSPFQLSSLSNKSRAPVIRYRVSVPSTPVGPLDIVSIGVHIQPLDSTVHIRSATAIVERRIQLNDAQLASPGPSTPPIPIPSSSSGQASSCFQSRSAPSSSSESVSPYHTSMPPRKDSHLAMYADEPIFTRSSSNYLNYPASASSFFSENDTRPLLPAAPATFPHPQSGAGDRVSTTTHIFADVESPGRFTRDANGVWKQTLSFSWPESKTVSRWAVGETFKTDTASVRFFVRVKTVVSSATNNAESIELDEQEIIVVSTNAAQRQLALAKYNELLLASSTARSKSKSPRRSKRPPDQLPSPPRSPKMGTAIDAPHTAPVTGGSSHQTEPSEGHGYKLSSASSPYPNSKPKGRNMRRPHTSAGPRDKPTGFHMRAYEPLQGENQLVVPMRPETALPSSTNANRSFSRGAFGQKWLVAPRMESSSTSASSSVETGFSVMESAEHNEDSLLFGRVNQLEVRAWEEELARIESVSRRTSADMMGLAYKRKRTNVERIATGPSIHTTYLYAEG
ncbi:hypothetical protein SERLA73DRAFT_186514 [Serpula lacrymans var. lacrymans S7.3]|uniref:Uncharacterized protein n=2 Tax=Serpula lacrymans var. lacrymans TaxID=341189 RepID=F8Q7E2_SERL3|nr:uncharacterized protein SERLADRAFT_475614 [Serpula lacrymans var. lacrymans S7.9]EGN95480.1 hypothetical protein SERLA73DRAFT_186514 [Serpula lacrymans var. lacrymans S7.3]EGO21007.1 hypothetical protein SERLADRAFT_475614 [Serpula lacrymans var. lacrymans S7.9]